MAAEWFAQTGKGTVGPLQAAQLVNLARQGHITPESLVRKGADGKWTKAGKVAGLFAKQAPSSSQTVKPPSTVPVTFFQSLVGSWRNGRAHWAWTLPVALVVLPLLSLSKPLLESKGLLIAVAVLFGVALLSRLLFAALHFARFYFRKDRAVRTNFSFIAWLGRISALLIPIVGAWTAAEYFSSPRGLLADYAPFAADEQQRLLAMLGHPIAEAKDIEPAKKAEPGPIADSTSPPDPQTEQPTTDTKEPIENRSTRSNPSSRAKPPAVARGGSKPEETPSLSLAERTWALLIGVQDYKFEMPLRATADDVETFGDALVKQGRVPEDHILRITDRSANKPDYAVLRAKTQEVLANPRLGPDSQLIIYFSGHGLVDPKNGAMYLAPRDVVRARIAETSISAEWLRDQLRNCHAGLKLLLLDSCHSGASKDIPVGSAMLERSFRYGVGATTISGCKGDESSYESQALGHGIFSYYLVEALHGAADRDGNGTIDIDELYRYVSEHVPQRASDELHQPQNPVRWIEPDLVGIPGIIQLPPELVVNNPEPPTKSGRSESKAKGFGGTIKTRLSEDFHSTRLGQLPASWTGDAGVGVQRDGLKSHLQPSNAGWHYVRTTPLDIWGDFQFETVVTLPPSSEIRATLSGVGVQEIKFGIRRDWNDQGDCYLADAQDARVHGFKDASRRLSLQREGDSCILMLDDVPVIVQRIDNPGRLQQLTLEISNPRTLVHSVMVQQALAERGEAPPKAKQLFFQDFANAKRGTLPTGWQGPTPLGVALEGSIGWLRTTKDEKVTATVDLPAFAGDFEIESHFNLPPSANLEIKLLDQHAPVSAAIRRDWAHSSMTELGDAKPVKYDGLSTYVSRLIVRREGEVFSLIVDGHELIVHRIPGFRAAQKLQLTIDKAATRVYDIGISQLPAAERSNK